MDRKKRLQEREARRRYMHKEIEKQLDLERTERNLRGDAPRIAAQRDPIEVPGQKFFVFSYAAPHTSPQHCKYIAIKIRGVFNTKEEADKRLAEVHQMDPDFDIFVLDMYEWIVIPPPVEHQTAMPCFYNQPKLQELMKNHYETVARGASEVQERMQKSVDEGRAKAAAWRAKYGYAGESISRPLGENETPTHPETVYEPTGERFGPGTKKGSCGK